jgi:hypothetical protein
MKKVEVQDAKFTNAAQRARKAGPHGKVKHADLSTQASPNKHLPPVKGESGVGAT